MGGGKILQFGFPVLWVWFRHRDKFRRPLAATNKSEFRTNALIGVGFGALVVIALYGVYYFLVAPTDIGGTMEAMVKEKLLDLGVNSTWKYLLLGLGYACVHTFLEEYYWRWFVFDSLDNYVSTLVANIVSSLGFMAHHVVVLAVYFGWSHPLTYLISACVGIGGSFWAWQFKRAGTLWLPWLSHLIVDAGIFSLGYLLMRGVLF
jgi:membrane protease YdiL (CAAX protease family)